MGVGVNEGVDVIVGDDVLVDVAVAVCVSVTVDVDVETLADVTIGPTVDVGARSTAVASTVGGVDVDMGWQPANRLARMPAITHIVRRLVHARIDMPAPWDILISAPQGRNRKSLYHRGASCIRKEFMNQCKMSSL